MEPVGAVDVVADDLMRVVDALRVRPLTVGAAGAREGIVDLGVEAPSGVEQEAVEWAGAGQKEADDLVRIVDALRNGLDRAQRVVERGVCSVAVDIAVEPEPAVLVRADDVAEIVDAVRLRSQRHWNIEGGVGSAAIEKAVALRAIEISDDLV